MSADLHEYGMPRRVHDRAVPRPRRVQYQAYAFDDWSHGHYETETLVGTRAGEAIADVSAAGLRTTTRATSY